MTSAIGLHNNRNQSQIIIKAEVFENIFLRLVLFFGVFNDSFLIPLKEHASACSYCVVGSVRDASVLNVAQTAATIVATPLAPRVVTYMVFLRVAEDANRHSEMSTKTRNLSKQISPEWPQYSKSATSLC